MEQGNQGLSPSWITPPTRTPSGALHPRDTRLRACRMPLVPAHCAMGCPPLGLSWYCLLLYSFRALDSAIRPLACLVNAWSNYGEVLATTAFTVTLFAPWPPMLSQTIQYKVGIRFHDPMNWSRGSLASTAGWAYNKRRPASHPTYCTLLLHSAPTM